MRDVSWNSWRKQETSLTTQMITKLSHIGQDTYFKQMLASIKISLQKTRKQIDRTSPTSGRLLVEDRSSCRCSRTKDWYSARQSSISLPLIQPLSKSPCSKRPSRWKGAWSSPPRINADKNKSIPVQSWNEQLPWRAQSSWIPPEIYGLSVGTLSSNTNSQSYYELPTPASQTLTLQWILAEI